MKRTTATFTAFLDNGERAEVTYKSEFNGQIAYNTLLSCIYKGVEIAPLFRDKYNGDDSPAGIYQAMENNAKSLWAESLEPA